MMELNYVGKILSGSSISEATMRIEGIVNVEDLIFIKTDESNGYLGVVRDILFYDEMLPRYKSQLPQVDIEVFKYKNAVLKLLGEIKNNKYIPYITTPPAPNSSCYKCTTEFLNEIFKQSSPSANIGYIGYHKFSRWKLGVRLEFINQHLGIFGATGTGKSVTTRRLIKALLDNNYRMIVFDHTGVDYAPYFPRHVVKSIDIEITPSSMTETILKKCELRPETFGDYVEIAAYDFIDWYKNYAKSSWEEFQRSPGDEINIGDNTTLKIERSKESVIAKILIGGKGIRNTIEKEVPIADFQAFVYAAFIQKVIDTMNIFGSWATTQLKFFVKFTKRLPADVFFKLVDRRFSSKDIIEKVLNERLLIVDLSYDPIEVRYGIINDILTEIWNRIESTGKPLDPPLIIIVDEAQNYTKRGTPCYYPLTRTAREGRKWGLGLVVVSQRFIADIDAEIRQNLCTILFSKMQTETDLMELNKVIDLGGITQRSMNVLERGDFFIIGLMNPLPHPILLHIEPYP